MAAFPVLRENLFRPAATLTLIYGNRLRVRDRRRTPSVIIPMGAHFGDEY
jgi:hypothetical protein